MKNIYLALIAFVFSGTSYSQIERSENKSEKPLYIRTAEYGENCYCFLEFSDPWDWANEYSQLQNDQLNLFFDRQRNAHINEIENRLNDNFTNYEDAARSLFENETTRDYADHYINDLKNPIIPAINSEIPIVQANRDKYWIFQSLMQGSNHNIDFGGLKYNNQLLESMSHSQAYQLHQQYGSLEINGHHTINQLKRRLAKLNKIGSENTLQNHLTNFVWNHHNNYEYYNKTRHMSGYLIAYANNQFPYYFNPSSLFPDLTFFDNPHFEYEADQVIDGMINNTTVTISSYSADNNITDHAALKRSYSVEKENIGLLVANFLTQHPDLRNAAQNYMEAHNYSDRAIYNTKEIIKAYIQDDPLDISTGIMDGNNVLLQTSDRPERLFDMRWKSDALGLDYGQFGNVLYELSRINSNQEQEGLLIKRFLDANKPGGMPSGIDYGLLFDFTLSGAGVGIGFSDYFYEHLMGDMVYWDGVYGWDLFNDGFKIQALVAMSNGGQVDFEEQIINTLTGKARCLHDKLNLLNNSKISNILANFEGDSQFGITITSLPQVYVEDSETGEQYEVNGRTGYTSGSSTIQIQINTNLAASRPALSVVSTIIHEYIHADIFRIVYNGSTLPEDMEFRNVYNSFEDSGFEPTPGHETMALLYIDVLKNALADFHQNVLVGDYNYLTNNGSIALDDFYEALAWQGLKNHDVQAYLDLSQSRKDEIQNALTQYYHSTTSFCPND